MDLNKLSVNNARVLACQMIEQANSGHPGIVLGATPMVYSLYANHLNVSPNQRDFFLRDRFVLSAGHGSAMLYTLLHLFGFGISANDLKSFRQLGSVCAGHPERNPKLGIEATTGPLGQGVANAVGLALAEKHLAAVFNKPNATIVNNYTYALVGDGDLMEGVSYEALSLAGTLKLNKLIVIYDFNKITIDGKTDITFQQNTKKVFDGYGFNVLTVKNGNDLKQINAAIAKAKTSKKPTLIMVNSIIGFGSVLAGTSKVHGAPLGAENLKDLQTKLEVNTGNFEVLPEVQQHFKTLQQRFLKVEQEWENRVNNYKTKYPQEFKKLHQFFTEDFHDVEKVLKPLTSDKTSISTRETGKLVLDVLTQHYQNIVGGAADLTSSTKTIVKNSGQFSHETPSERNIMFGIREFGMSAVTNGIAMYGGLTPFASTFFVFSDYLKSGLRSSAIMGLKTLYIFTHDSIGVGEDGPTHQPVEHLTALRATPNVTVFRPANLEETKAGYMLALKNNAPTVLALTRQNLLNFASSYTDALKGGYVLSPEKGALQGILIATGSEVELCLKAQAELMKKGVSVRVVSMPSQEVFDKQTATYKNSVLPETYTNRFAVEAGATLSWYKYVGKQGTVIGLDSFGESGNYEQVFNHFHITVKDIIKAVLKTV